MHLPLHIHSTSIKCPHDVLALLHPFLKSAFWCTCIIRSKNILSLKKNPENYYTSMSAYCQGRENDLPLVIRRLLVVSRASVEQVLPQVNDPLSKGITLKPLCQVRESCHELGLFLDHRCQQPSWALLGKYH